MKITFIGDVHGKTPQLERLLDVEKGGLSFQVGDMGLGFKGVKLRERDTKYFQFIRGNHDSPAACEAHPNYAGDYTYYPETGLYALGGAWSIDWEWRVEGVSWWRDEELSAEELNRALDLYVKTKPKYVVTHEAPTIVAYNMLYSLILPPATQYDKDNPCYIPDKGPAYKEYKNKVGFANTRTSQVLQQMFDVHQPREWIFGHYHLDKSFEINGTKFTCVAELSKYTLEVNSKMENNIDELE